MFYSKEYDDALWLIASGNKKVGKGIFMFLEHYPADLFESMRIDLMTYERFAGINQLHKIEGVVLAEKAIGADGKVYWYDVDKNTGELELGVINSLENGRKNNEIVLTLNRVNLKDCLELGNDEIVELGSMSVVKEKTVKGYTFVDSVSEANFTLGKNLFDKTVVETFVSGSLKIGGSSLVDVTAVPNSLSINDVKEAAYAKKRILG